MNLNKKKQIGLTNKNNLGFLKEYNEQINDLFKGKDKDQHSGGEPPQHPYYPY